MKNLYLIFLCFIFTGMGLNAQHQTCGTVPDEAMLERLERNIRNSDLNWETNRSGVMFVPVTMHLVGDNNGGQRISDEQAAEGFCKMNEYYEPYGLQFYLPNGFNYIDNSSIMDNSASSFVVSLQKVSGTVNIFVGHTTGSGACAGVLGYYTPASDFIFMTKCAVNSTSQAMAHEAGHFFSLQHTFFGWENTEYEMGTVAPATVFYGGAQAVETVARTGSDANCANSADRFCGTPPDYNFGFGAAGCFFTGNAYDPLGVEVDPMERNFMGYFFNCSSYEFATDQFAAILADVNSRSWASGTADGPIAGAPDLLAPIGGVVVDHTSVAFSWEEEPNAVNYTLEINRTPNFIPNFAIETVSLSTNSYTSTALADGLTYYWRVKPTNNYDFCTGFSSAGTFVTGNPTAVQELSSLKSFGVYPNPSQGANNVFLELNMEKGIDAQIQVYQADGKLLRSIANTFQTGINRIELDVNALNSGVYFVAIQNEEGVAYRKLVITK